MGLTYFQICVTLCILVVVIFINIRGNRALTLVGDRMSCAHLRFWHTSQWLSFSGPSTILPCSLRLLQRDLGKKNLLSFKR